MVVDSHVKGPKQSPGEVCKAEGEKCEHDSECCAPQWHSCELGKGICIVAECLDCKGKERIGKENLVVKTQFNSVKNALVVDSHIKSPKQSQGKVCKPLEQECEHNYECCDNLICMHHGFFPIGKKICYSYV